MGFVWGYCFGGDLIGVTFFFSVTCGGGRVSLLCGLFEGGLGNYFYEIGLWSAPLTVRKSYRFVQIVQSTKCERSAL